MLTVVVALHVVYIIFFFVLFQLSKISAVKNSIKCHSKVPNMERNITSDQQ